ncbi:hypothetical protein FPQ18DRAFT_310962 [Pyronema domesticum]|nr:hypothetical protein FPQ18DRAFT_310962 [Pyronema domesticum]
MLQRAVVCLPLPVTNSSIPRHTRSKFHTIDGQAIYQQSNYATLQLNTIHQSHHRSCHSDTKLDINNANKGLLKFKYNSFKQFQGEFDADQYMDTALNRVPALDAQKIMWKERTPMGRLGNVADMTDSDLHWLHTVPPARMITQISSSRAGKHRFRHLHRNRNRRRTRSRMWWPQESLSSISGIKIYDIETLSLVPQSMPRDVVSRSDIIWGDNPVV